MRTEIEQALQTLGLPDSPVIHLAICTVAELLQPLDAHSAASSRDKSIGRVRVASRTVLESWPIEYARIDCRAQFGLDIEPEAADAALRLPRTDWLGGAKTALEAIGVDPGPDVQMATRYGWRPNRRADPERSSGGTLRWDPVWSPKPRTDTERSKLLQEVADRVKNATPEQKQAALERSRRSSALPKLSTKG